MYRVCKIFEIESGHFLLKHKEKCKNPHGHTRKIEVTVSAKELNENDMVFDFKLFKLAFFDFIDRFDHAMVINTSSADFEFFQKTYERVIGVENVDPTTEVLSKLMFEFIQAEIDSKKVYQSSKGFSYQFPPNIKLEKVRVWETASTWAEFSLD